jgi:hypothetical protein
VLKLPEPRAPEFQNNMIGLAPSFEPVVICGLRPKQRGYGSNLFLRVKGLREIT